MASLRYGQAELQFILGGKWCIGRWWSERCFLVQACWHTAEGCKSKKPRELLAVHVLGKFVCHGYLSRAFKLVIHELDLYFLKMCRCACIPNICAYQSYVCSWCFLRLLSPFGFIRPGSLIKHATVCSETSDLAVEILPVCQTRGLWRNERFICQYVNSLIGSGMWGFH